MCGIAGLFLEKADGLEPLLREMSDALSHRGPDDDGIWVSEEVPFGMCHRRLSIVDLHDSSHQPMISQCGRYVMVYNGEIYNYKSLAHELNLGAQSTFGDSRVLIESIAQFGLEKTLEQILGMYSFAIWDKVQKELVIARDPIGIKPLYYGKVEGGWAFASELSAIKKVLFNPLLSNKGLGALLNYGNVVSPLSIFEQVEKCSPGMLLKVNANGEVFEKRHFHSIQLSVRKGLLKRKEISEEEADHALKEKLTQSIQEHLIADVKVGCFLSGGIDSSLICALAQENSEEKVNTFTIGMEESGYDEAQNAREIAKHLGTSHNEYYLKPNEMAEAVPQILDLLDEPFADSSLIPTYFVSKLTSEKVKVSLSGDGGDELFCGYTRYKWSRQLWSTMKYIPMPLKSALSFFILASSRATWDQRYSKMKIFLPSRFKETHFGQKLYNLEKTLSAKSSFEIYKRLVGHISNFDQHLLKPLDENDLPPLSPFWGSVETLEEKMMLTDLMHYLPNDILTKVDRASMMVGLEARVPFLTPDMVEFAWSLPLKLKYNKYLLKRLLLRYVPNDLVDRPKMGFGIAIGQWLRGPLKPWADDLLDPSKLKAQGLFCVDSLLDIWHRHLNHQQNHEYLLWNYLVFLHWYRKNFS